jgi:hypothetical protein
MTRYAAHPECIRAPRPPFECRFVVVKEVKSGGIRETRDVGRVEQPFGAVFRRESQVQI